MYNLQIGRKVLRSFAIVAVIGFSSLVFQGCHSQSATSGATPAPTPQQRLKQAQDRLNDPNISPQERSALQIYIKAQSGQPPH